MAILAAVCRRRRHPRCVARWPPRGPQERWLTIAAPAAQT